ncbi:DUF7619 domain-containing protein [Halocola ammonii]
MKYLLLATMLFSGSLLFAQCENPIVSDWFSTDENSFTVVFEAPTGASSYTLSVFQEYDDSALSVPELVHSQDGSASEGINTINVSFSNEEHQYYAAELTIACPGGDSEITHFYLSRHSMLNDPAFSCSEELFYMPSIYLADGAGFMYEANIPVSPGDIPQEVGDLSVFVDIGHTYLGDLSIQLISPQGTAIDLMAYPSGLGGTMGLSVLFQDGAPEIESGIYNGAGPSGIFAPTDSLSTFAGESMAGVWKIRVTDNLAFDNGFIYGICLSLSGTPCEASLAGTAFLDENGNSTFDTEELPMQYAVISNSLEGEAFSTNSSGSYLDCTIPGSGELTLENVPNYHTAEPVLFDVAQDEMLMELDFPVTPVPGIEDLSIDIFPLEPDRPGFDNTYRVYFFNEGTECLNNVHLGVKMDDATEVTGSSLGTVIAENDSVSVDLGTLCIYEEGYFDIEIVVDDTVSIGSVLTSSASISPLLNDETPENNSITHESTVVGAFDPNDKQVSHEVVGSDFVNAESPLKYMVRFQNTGNYYAENVVIIDTIDTHLDLSTFDLQTSSHPVEVSREGRVLFFEFNEIYLPDSTSDLEGSQGFVRFELETVSDFSQGEQIDNKAYIYFDFNAPIITNTATTIFDEAIGLKEKQLEAAIYPNPTQNFIVIDWPTTTSVKFIEVFDLTGKRVLLRSGLKGEQSKIDLSGLEKGVYTVKFNPSSNLKSKLIVKM